MSTIERAKSALLKRCLRATDERGYVATAQDNLIPGVRLDQFEGDLRRGAGNELEEKFLAVHSSSALAVNCFAPFKERSSDLSLLGRTGATRVAFEEQLEIIPGRRPAHLDVWIEQGARVVAVESKLLEYLKAKKPVFAPAYEGLGPPGSEEAWWGAYQEARVGEAQHLDRAQLIKHYFGMARRRFEQGGQGAMTLLYLFWEPSNWSAVEECQAHRSEVEAFARQVSGSPTGFSWMSYCDLWNGWAETPVLQEHVARLRERYEVEI